jgi:hypothetical protein
MAKAGEISGKIGSISDYSLNRNFYMPNFTQTKKKTIASRLRKGEIISGSVLSDAHNSIATVRLPVGTFDAKLHSKLKKGDRLFFIVAEEKPVLTLRVHSVNIILNGRRIPDDDILRMLDFEENPLNYAIVDVLADLNSEIIRDSFLKIIENYGMLSESFLDNKQLSSILKTIYWLNEADIEFTYENVLLFYPLFRGLKFFESLVAEFIVSLESQNSSSSQKLLSIFELLDTEYQFSFFASFYSKHLSSGSLLYNRLKDIIINKDLSSKSINLASQIVNVIDAFHKWNAIAEIKTVPYRLYMPLSIANEKYIHTQLIIQNYNSKNFKSSIKIEKDDPDCDLGAKIARIEELAFPVEIFKNENYEIELKEFAVKARNEMLKYNLSLQALIINYNGKETDFLPDFPKSPARRISVVV